MRWAVAGDLEHGVPRYERETSAVRVEADGGQLSVIAYDGAGRSLTSRRFFAADCAGCNPATYSSASQPDRKADGPAWHTWSEPIRTLGRYADGHYGARFGRSWRASTLS
jgi:hypothetical protein